jgi:hypothetical protein
LLRRSAAAVPRALTARLGDGLERSASDGAVGEKSEQALDEVIQDAEVGVKCTCQRGRLANQLRISLVLWVP